MIQIPTWITVEAMPPQRPTVAIVLPFAEARPDLIASSSSQPSIAAGIPSSGPQQRNAPIAISIEIIARCVSCGAATYWPPATAPPTGFCGQACCCAPTVGPAPNGVAQLWQKAACAGFDKLHLGQVLFIYIISVA